jgi:hypothetical protein
MKWVTKEGFEIEPREMATPHLLNTIHLIERSRMSNLVSLGMNDLAEVSEGVVEFYARWPEAYDALLDEAERRQLIRRGDKTKKLRGRR